MGADPDVVGRVVRIDGEPSTVVGVMPEGVRFPFRAEVWLPLQPTETFDGRDVRALATVGRLRPGVGLEEAQAELSAIAGQLRRQHPETNENTRATVQSFNDWATGANVRLIYLTLAGAVAFVLLIACAHVANLLIARSAQRAHEFAIRSPRAPPGGRSCGSCRWRTSSWEPRTASSASRWRRAVYGWPSSSLGTCECRPGWRSPSTRPVIAFFMGLCAATTLLFGLAPLLHLAARGRIWVDRETHEIARLEFELIDRVRLWWGLVGTIHHSRGSLDRGPVLDGIWASLQNESYSDIRFFFSRSRQASFQRWRDYAWTEEPAPLDASTAASPDAAKADAR